MAFNYHIDKDGLAVVTIETAASRPGKPVTAEITAKLTQADHGPVAELVSVEGEATQADIEYALAVIETDDRGVSL